MANPQRLRYRPRVTEAFSFLDPLNAIPGVRAAWIGRIPGFPISGDRDSAMRALRPRHEAEVAAFAGPSAAWWRAEQVHGISVALVPGAPTIVAPDGLPAVAGADGLISCTAGIVLCVYVADCGAIWLADRATGAIGLIHSGKKGTEGNILGEALARMAREFGTRAEDVTAVLSPCIRKPHYEVDFAGEIRNQARCAGVGGFLDSGCDTAADPERFYSYRMEKGETGRMMALIVRDFPQ